MTAWCTFSRRAWLLAALLALGSGAGYASAETTPEAGGAYPIRAVPFTKVRLLDTFWAPRLQTNRRVTIPFGFRKSEEEGRLRNFERAAGRRPGGYEGKMPFDDTDVYKLIEGASYSLQGHPDPQLDRFLDGIIAKVAEAQEPDGYLTTYKTIDASQSPAPWLKPGPRWDLELQGSHELYNAGHLYEAAYAHYRATGKRTLLDVALRNADLVDRTFGPGRRLTPPGHQIVETGLFKLAEATGEGRYRTLARFFLDQRGNAAGHTLHGPYNQDHLPVLEQRAAVGHAVRAAYMYSAMVDVAALQEDPLYAEAIQRIWEDVVARKLYLTGGIGARHDGEAFGDEFELPNRTAYAETCASIANVYWNQRLFLQSGDARYVDVLERTLYNAALAGVSLEGNTFFYPNPLESDGRFAFNNGAATRKPWFDSSCCPTNVARFLPSLPDYVYATRGDSVFVNLFVASRARFDLAGAPLTLTQRTGYPWQGRVEIAVDPGRPRAFALRVRIPGWARGQPVPSALYRYLEATPSFSVQVNGRPAEAKLEHGYAVLARTWTRGDRVTLDLPMTVRRVVADERVIDDRGKVALERGPLVYCAEDADNDGHALDLTLPDEAGLDAVWSPDLLHGVTVLRGTALGGDGSPRPLVAIPYYAWSHRGPGAMAVWLTRRPPAPPAAAQAENRFLTWAATPPMGWNSWDSFGTTITEAQAKAQADFMSTHLLAHGWRILTVDIQWYEPGASGHSYRADAPLTLDEWGRLLPAPNRFPSAANGAGFKPLADYVHGRGLQFGIHLMRGIPRLAVERNLPVKGTAVRAADVADRASTCPWNPDMYGVDMDRPGAQAYYDSVFELIASWGVDFVKVDDISRPYHEHAREIEAIRRAIDRTGRPIVLSLSPGETALTAAGHAQRHANMWRISDDFWDTWPALREQFGRLARWNPYRGAGHWPDADMLPLGVLDLGRRATRFTPDEQRTLVTLWSIARSPLIHGGDMTRTDAATLALLTNDEVIAVNQHSQGNRPLFDHEGLVAWTAEVPRSRDRYLALFNTRDRFPLDLRRPAFESPLVTRTTEGKGVPVDVDVRGRARLVLLAEGGEDGSGWDHALWALPRLVMEDGTTRKLTDWPWTQATCGWGEVSTEKAPSGGPLAVDGRNVPYGIAAHAPSLVEYALPPGAVRFQAVAAIDDGALTQPGGATVRFSVHALPAPAPADPAGARIRVALADLGLSGRCRVRDLWQKGELPAVEGEMAPVVPWHGAALYRLTPEGH
jgi:DUF1680 family protein